jgi:hypothetical protein
VLRLDRDGDDDGSVEARLQLQIAP